MRALGLRDLIQRAMARRAVPNKCSLPDTRRLVPPQADRAPG